jgi:tRNA pseudouridine38-40 synthase
MVKAARLFAGQHDFSSFRAVDCQAKSTVRTLIRSELTRTSPEELVLTVYGTGFLKQMIRIMTGTLVDVGLGRLQPADIPRIIAAQTRPAAGPTAPPQGLFLEWVRYLERPYYGAEL